MNVHRVHRVILGLIIIMVFIGGCGYSYEKETEAMSTEMIIGVDEEGADSVELYEDEPAYKYEIPTIDLEDIATENILCENILVDVKKWI